MKNAKFLVSVLLAPALLIFLMPSCGKKSSQSEIQNPQSEISDSTDSYPLFPDEAEAVTRYNADMTASNLENVARIRFMYAGALGERFDKTGETNFYIRALNYAESAVELNPRNAYYHFLLAYLYSLTAKANPFVTTLAEEHAQAALDINPAYTEARTLLANLYLWRNSYNNALNEYEKLVQDDPRYIRPDTLASMCCAYRQDDQQDRGEAFFRSLLKKYPDSATIKIGLAVMLKDQNKKREAKDLLHAVLKGKIHFPDDQGAARVCLREWFGEGVQP